MSMNSRLTSREVAVLNLVAAGLTNRQIARRLGIAEKTVKNHLTAIFPKIGVTDRTRAALYALHSLSDGGQPGLGPQDVAAPAPEIQALTSRESGVLRLVVAGLTNRQIARRLGIAEKTVKNHLTAIFPKIGVTDRTQAAIYAVRAALPDPDEAATDFPDHPGPGDPPKPLPGAGVTALPG